MQAGKINGAKRRPLSDEARARLRAAALANQPWRHATGPRTPGGKARAAANGRVRQKGEMSVRQLRRETAQVHDLILQGAQLRKLAQRRGG